VNPVAQATASVPATATAPDGAAPPAETARAETIRAETIRAETAQAKAARAETIPPPRAVLPYDRQQPTRRAAR
jgi:hypothetical protein